ncbi:Uma2 family endonuclease [Nocardia terpenica]|uniref:Uma2 family endonuclease n=1 Tax=Nocardia terpenica TaxID=455432 RepID=UPI001893C572|nr:Uma2 family endonuclease [Nocardia terpenica]MBF6066283.1 Uma2 family endonuclease [Nocardia terpenica]MBF6108587.1 Uma2 family endonuclease [Nocardia terpenica]MBF6116133.1 Uma2 family endonuclease [Nocardia terpenica]MBF6123746.1 Uma2 family endonuclease [Nocardia terpenica]MBF6157107.1 Uma2 family endonuclease [Nocardia terpenica]
MTAEVSTIHPLGPMTVEDWLAEDQPADGSRLELILGYLYMTPPPTGSHQHATFRLAVWLDDSLKAAGRSDLHVLPGVGVRLSTAFRTGVIPDVVVVDVDVNHTSFAPDNVVLAVEVWSSGNTRAERDTKVAAYAGARIPYLWIVELPDGQPAKFWGYRFGQTGYRQEIFAEAGEAIMPPAPVKVEVPTADLR